MDRDPKTLRRQNTARAQWIEFRYPSSLRHSSPTNTDPGKEATAKTSIFLKNGKIIKSTLRSILSRIFMQIAFFADRFVLNPLSERTRNAVNFLGTFNHFSVVKNDISRVREGRTIEIPFGSRRDFIWNLPSISSCTKTYGFLETIARYTPSSANES